MDDSNKQNIDTVIWFKRPAWLASLASLIAAVSFAAFVIVGIRDSATLDAIEENQDSLDELVCFVRLVSQDATDGNIQDALQECILDRDA